ncbi:MAG: substrate-binding domain-containing protein, partial [Limnohabitans sp.]
MARLVSDRNSALRGISSMATKALLEELTSRYFSVSGIHVQIESLGGVDAAKRVQDGEPFDMVLLACDALQRLMQAGYLQMQSQCNWAHSSVAVAVPVGHVLPPIAT